MREVAVFGIVGGLVTAFAMVAVASALLTDREGRALLEDARQQAARVVWLAYRLVRPRPVNRGRRRA